MPRVIPTTYRHDQLSPAITWTIQHNLSGGGGSIPIVDAFVQIDGKNSKIMPSAIDIIDNNTVRLTFSQPRFGFAIILM